jgi:hypothetical protein
MPVGIPLLIGLTAAGTAVDVYGRVKAGKAEQAAGAAAQAAANDQADLSDYNAEVADLQAQDALARGAEQESRYRTQVRAAISTQRATLAANDVAVGFGSAADVQADAAYLGELDALTIRTNAAREAWGYQVQAADLHRQAAITRKTGVAAAAAGGARATADYLSAGSTILSAGTSLLQAKYGFGRAGGTA